MLLPAIIVDDDPEVAETVGDIITTFFPELEIINTFQEGDTATNFLRENPGKIKLVISDVNMPGRSGLEVLEEFGGTADFIIMSALPENKDDAYRLGAIRFFGKPFSFDDFCRFLKEYSKKKLE